jgi:hypothetical protein
MFPTINAPIAALAPFNLLSHPAGNAAKLLRYQSSFLRLCAAGAPKPWFQFQSSFLRLWAESCEMAARNLENFAPRTGKQQQPKTPIQNTRLPEAWAQAEQRADDGAKQDNNIIDQLNVAAAEAAGKWAATSAAVTADELRTAEMNRKPANIVRRASTARKKAAKKTSKPRRAKTARPAKSAAASSKTARKTWKFSKGSRGRK